MLGPKSLRQCLKAAGRHHGQTHCRATGHASQAAFDLQVLPLPGRVALPHANLPITLSPTSEYRAFFESLTTKSELAGGEALQAIGVQGNPHDRKPRFGICQAQNADGGMNLSPVGTLMEVTDLQQLPDGRMHVVARGQQRFQVVGVVEGTPGAGAGSGGSSSSPELVCSVQLLKEETSPKEAPEAMRLAGEVLSLLPNYLRVYVRARAQERGPDLPAFVASLGPGLTRSSLQAWISGKADNPELEARVMCNLAHMQPEELDLYSMRPAEVSYFVASLFTSMPELQQHLLQENSTLARLQIEREVLQGT